MIGLLHPGQMGAAIGAQLVGAGHAVLWCRSGRSASTARRAEAAGLHGVDTLAELLLDANHEQYAILRFALVKHRQKMLALMEQAATDYAKVAELDEELRAVVAAKEAAEEAWLELSDEG